MENEREVRRVFGAAEWTTWVDTMARRLYGMSGDAFEGAYARGELRGGSAEDIASVLPLVRRLRQASPS